MRRLGSESGRLAVCLAALVIVPRLSFAPRWEMAKNLTVPVLIGGSQEALQRQYHIESTLATYLLDENGKVQFHEDGYKPGDEKQIEARIQAKLSGASVAPVTEQNPPCPPVSDYVQPAVAIPQIVGAWAR